LRQADPRFPEEGSSFTIEAVAETRFLPDTMNVRRSVAIWALAGVLVEGVALPAQSIDFFTVVKKQDFLQNSASTPVSHSVLGAPGGAFNFGVDIVGSNLNLLSPAPTVTLPNNTTSYTLADLDPGMNDELGLLRDFSNKSAMDAAFPNGKYKFTIGASAITVSLGNADLYPTVVPMVGNGVWDAQGNLLVDATQGTTLFFNPFYDYTTGIGAEIQFDVYSLSGTTLVGNPIDLSSSYIFGQETGSRVDSATIAPHTLQPNQIYYAELSYARVVSVSETYMSAVNVPLFVNLTGFMISTFPPTVAPAIIQPPYGQVVVAGNPVSFTASATGTPTPTYQWQKNNVTINGATGPSYSIAHATPGDAGDYRVVATNSVGSATSIAATLTVKMYRADFNADGLADLIWENTATGERYLCLMNQTTYGSSAFLGIVPTQWHVAGTGDFNGDGQADLVWENTVTGERYLWLMNGTSFAASVFLGVVPTDWQIAGTGDFNGDGQVDLVWQNAATGERYVWLMNGTSFAASVFLGVVSTDWQIAGTGDFDGDGQVDLVWENTATGECCFWLMKGSSFGSAVSLGVVPTQWRIAGAADFDLDGRPDLIWQNTTTGERWVWLLMFGTKLNYTVFLGTVPVQWQISI